VSTQALMTRIERLEQALVGGGPPSSPPPKPPKVEPPEPAAGDGGVQASAAPQPEPPRSAATPPERAAARAEAAVAASAVMEAAPAVEGEPAAEAEPVAPAAPGFDLDQLKALWPAVVEAVCEENQMVGAYLANGRPRSLENGRLTVCFGEESDFAKKTVKRKRELPSNALRQLTGQTIEIVYELVEGEQGDAELVTQASSSLSSEQFLERLKQEFGATEVFDEQES
jgi:hypothetical protein